MTGDALQDRLMAVARESRRWCFEELARQIAATGAPPTPEQIRDIAFRALGDTVMPVVNSLTDEDRKIAWPALVVYLLSLNVAGVMMPRFPELRQQADADDEWLRRLLDGLEGGPMH